MKQVEEKGRHKDEWPLAVLMAAILIVFAAYNAGDAVGTLINDTALFGQALSSIGLAVVFGFAAHALLRPVLRAMCAGMV